MGFIKHQISPFFRRRKFSDKFSDTTDFITANRRPLLKMLTIAILPVCAIQALSLNNLTSMMYGELASDSDDTMGILVGFGLNYGATMILGMIASLFLLSIVYALMKLYHATNEDGTPVNEDLTKMTFKEFLPYARRQMGAAWKSVLALKLFFVVNILLVVAIIAVLQAANIGVFMILFAWFVALIPPAMMLIPVYSFEPIGFWAGMRKAFVYGFKTWGGIVAITFVVGLITNVYGKSFFGDRKLRRVFFRKLHMVQPHLLSVSSSLYLRLLCRLFCIAHCHSLSVRTCMQRSRHRQL